MGFSRQEYWSELPCPPPGDLPHPGIEPVAPVVPALQEPQESWVGSLGGEDPLEEGMATHSTILAWRIPWTEEPGGAYSPWGRRVGHN